MEWRLKEHEVIDSTNLEARRLVAAGEGAGLVVWARHQTGGRGRRERTWWNLPGRSLLASLVLEDMEGTDATRLLSVAAVSAIQREAGRGPLIKWPNDLVYGRKKVGGILAESFLKDGTMFTVVGVGINLNYSAGELDFPSRLPVTSLQIEEHRPWDAEALLSGLIREVDARLTVCSDELLFEYRRQLAYVGETISVLLNPTDLPGKRVERQAVQGVMEGVDDNGLLLLRVGDRVQKIGAADIHKVDVRPAPSGESGLHS